MLPEVTTQEFFESAVLDMNNGQSYINSFRKYLMYGSLHVVIHISLLLNPFTE